MSIEARINYQLNKYPAVKKVVKRVYQRAMYTISPKIKSEWNIIRVSPDDPNHEYFFGYYDKSPWDATDRYMLCLKANDTWSDVSPKEEAEIILIDTQNNNKVTCLARTHSWNVQQSCMLQWLGPDFKDRIIFNDCRNGEYCSVILKLDYNGDEVTVKEEKVIPAPVYSVSADGSFALTLDFSRLYNLRPGYGYFNVPEKTKGVALPDSTAIWKVDLVTGEVSDVLKYTDFASFEPRSEMKEEGSVHKVNHIMLSPNGKRFMVLYRWFCGQRKYTRLITCNIGGSDMYVLSDDDMVSHCCWKNNSAILAFENKKNGGPGYYLMKDKTQKFIHCWPQFSNDGHPSYSPDGSHIVTDSYPNRARVASINLMDGNEKKKESTTIARVFAPFKYDNDTRCDLHPRWNRAGNKICFDSVFEGHRGLYTVEVCTESNCTDLNADVEIGEDDGEDNSPLISVIIPVYKVEEYLHRCVDSVRNQSYKNLEIILVDDGSPDSCGVICDEIARTDYRVRVIHKKNGGLSSARNAGMDVAKGDYIAFVDSDDWIALDTYEYMIKLMKQYNVEVVDIDCQYAYSSEDAVLPRDGSVEIYTGEDVLWHYLYRGLTVQNNAPYSACRKLYKRELIDKKRFAEGKNSEDFLFNYEIIKQCKMIVVSNLIKYMYFQNRSSISMGPLKKSDLSLLEISEYIRNEEKENHYREINKLTEIKLSRSYFSILARIALSGCSSEIGNPKQLTEELTINLRKKLWMLLKSPISTKRKILMIIFALDYRLLQKPYAIYKHLKEPN